MHQQRKKCKRNVKKMFKKKYLKLIKKMTGCVRLQNCVYMKCLNKGGNWSANIKF